MTKNEIDDDNNSSSSSSSSSGRSSDSSNRKKNDNKELLHLPNVLCLQIYIETDDYVLRDDDKLGVTMYTNRPLKKDEPFFVAPVGPKHSNKKLLYADADVDATIDADAANEKEHETSAKVTYSKMSIQRREFMDRYLSWQDKYYNDDNQEVMAAAGASDIVFTKLTTVDFQRVPPPEEEEDEDEDDTVLLPTSMNPSYFFDLQASDYVIVEFIPNPATTPAAITVSKKGGSTTDNNTQSSIPDRRRFEVLPFDEAICWDGEPNYNPWTMNNKRPPNFDNEERGLEIPGHFSNHACGKSAAMYDLYRMPTRKDEEDDNENENDTESRLSRVVAPGQPTEIQRQIKDYCTTKVWPKTLFGDDLRNVMTSHRAILINTEVTTDYVLWHWSNDEYGNSNKDATIMEPWFHCLCHDSNCHSQNGFKGVKYMTLDEQKRLYRVCSHRIQNHIDWKVYQLEEQSKKQQKQV